MQTSDAMRREIAASHSTVIVRKSGRSSIPETVVIEPKSRDVLDTPPSRGMTVVERVSRADQPLPQPQLLIRLRRHLVASRPISRRAAAVAGDDAGLLAFDVGIDAGHPGIDLVGQQPNAERFHMIGPGGNTLRRRLQARQLPFHRETNEPRHPVDAVFDAARDVAERGVWSHQHQHVGKLVNHDAEIGLRPALPFILEAHPVCAAKIDLVKTAGDGVEAGRIDDDVERVFPVAGSDALRRDAFDRHFVDVDQLDIILVVDLIIKSLERQPSGAKTVIFRDQLLATTWFFTRCRILRATKSEIVALALRSISMSRKLPCQMPKPRSP